MATHTKIDTFTSSGTWVCPVGVTGILATLVGPGGGAPGGNAGGTAPSVGIGGAGSGEILVGVPMAVIPGNSYTVTIGAGGIGSARNVAPSPAGTTLFNGKCANGSPGYPPGIGYQETCAGTGGGWLGLEGSQAGGYPGTPISPGRAAGAVAKRECGWGTGGVCGAMGSRADPGHKVTPLNFDKTENASGTPGTVGFITIACIIGGSNHPYHGLIDPTFNQIYGGGGAGGGTIFGGNMGCDYNLNHANADPTHYGSGAPGGGSAFTPVQALTNGGNGASGIVMIMYIG